MDDKRFDRPVKVRLAEGAKVLSVSSAYQASGLLASTDWPAKRTALHRVAFEAAEKVLEGSAPRSTVAPVLKRPLAKLGYWLTPISKPGNGCISRAV
ncbi:DUF982 domain-containing protein [Mesorhizobium sp. IMUNJ 23033]|uniref:DUF982 domain-containing protein n=1 Tax=Mesorhizobium sp. IMUNJ 23033 TaxID=3378039 RepID=UPI00384AFC56